MENTKDLSTAADGDIPCPLEAPLSNLQVCQWHRPSPPVHSTCTTWPRISQRGLAPAALGFCGKP